jgi:putative transposase
VHVTLRARPGIPSLRSTRIFSSLRASLSASHKSAFRVVHFSVQSDHVHLVVEGDAPVALVRGVQGLAGRCAKAVNRAAARRGRVWSSRFHSHALRTPTETRCGLVLRPAELQEAPRRVAGRRPAQLGSLVRRLADTRAGTP